MELMEAIRGRRSVRRFEDTPLPREQVERILEAGTLAPSSKNRQPWRFVAVQGAARQGMLDAMRAGMDRERTRPLLPNSAQHHAGAEQTLRIMAQAPVTVFVCNPLETAALIPADMETAFYHLANTQSAGAALQNMALAAQDMGLGSLWICDVFFAYPELCAWLGGGDQLVAAMSFGVPAEQPRPRPRKPAPSLTTWRE